MRADKEAHLRSVLKAVSYRLCAAVATTTIVFVFTRRLPLSLAIGAVEAVAKIIFYYLHERAWSFIKLGKSHHPLASLDIKRDLGKKDIEIIKSKLRELGYISEDVDGNS